MCYEYSEWFTKARAANQARERQPKAEQVTQPSKPVPEPRPPETRIKERETAPA